MKLTIFFVIVALISTAAGGPVVNGSSPISDPQISAESGRSVDYSDVYVEYIRFYHVGCGVPSSSWSMNRGKRDVSLDKWALAHSMVEFRDKWYEWGFTLWVYKDGGIGREGSTCPVLSHNKGESRCTTEQADRLGQWYMNNYNYNLFTNNCHFYSEWLVNRLLNNRCEI